MGLRLTCSGFVSDTEIRGETPTGWRRRAVSLTNCNLFWCTVMGCFKRQQPLAQFCHPRYRFEGSTADDMNCVMAEYQVTGLIFRADGVWLTFGNCVKLCWIASEAPGALKEERWATSRHFVLARWC